LASLLLVRLLRFTLLRADGTYAALWSAFTGEATLAA